MKINKESLSNQIKEEIKRRIINVEIKQGEKIDVASLEGEFNVSRAPVREALKSLADEGLVEVKPREGYFAVDLTQKQIKDLCEFREFLEEFALTKSLENIPEDKVKSILKKTIQLKEKEVAPDSLRDQFDITDEKIHKSIIKHSNNEYLIEIAEKIHNLIALTRHLNERIDKAIEEHISILRAILEKDKPQAKNALKEHLVNVKEETLSRNGSEESQ